MGSSSSQELYTTVTPLCGKSESKGEGTQCGLEWTGSDSPAAREQAMSPRTARKNKPEDESFEVTPSPVVLNVLGYREDGDWVALALEMDLRGYGSTFGEALQELRDLVATQIRFAQFKGQADLVWKSAEPVWFERFADVL